MLHVKMTTQDDDDDDDDDVGLFVISAKMIENHATNQLRQAECVKTEKTFPEPKSIIVHRTRRHEIERTESPWRSFVLEHLTTKYSSAALEFETFFFDPLL